MARFLLARKCGRHQCVSALRQLFKLDQKHGYELQVIPVADVQARQSCVVY
jgi:hypothetical protein